MHPRLAIIIEPASPSFFLGSDRALRRAVMLLMIAAYSVTWESTITAPMPSLVYRPLARLPALEAKSTVESRMIKTGSGNFPEWRALTASTRPFSKVFLALTSVNGLFMTGSLWRWTTVQVLSCLTYGLRKSTTPSS